MEGPWEQVLERLEQENNAEDAFLQDGVDGAISLEKCADDAFQAEIDAYKSHGQAPGDREWLRKMLQSGTAQDEVSALAVAGLEAPVHFGVTAIDRLAAVASKKSRTHSVLALDALRDIFIGLLPASRMLRALPPGAMFASSTATQFHLQFLILRAFEHALRDRYDRFVTLLESGVSDTLEWYRIKIVQTAYELLSERPEQEHRLLALIVNRLGDSARRVTAKAVRVLELLLEKHGAMARVIVDEVERFTMRSIGPRALYNALVFLSQMRLSSADRPLAVRLIRLYLDVFRRCLTEDASAPSAKRLAKKARSSKEESKLFSALLSGINRAFPFAEKVLEDDILEEHSQHLFRLAHSNNIATALQAMMVLFQLQQAGSRVSDRFYRALYEMLISSQFLDAAKRHIMLLNLVYRALKSDVRPARIAAFVHRLLQVALQARPGFVCGVLCLVSQLIEQFPAVKALIEYSRGVQGAEDDVEVFDDKDESSDEGKQSAQSRVGHRIVREVYDPLKRDAEHADATTMPLWELSQMSNHYHPSVVSMATTLLNGEKIVYEGDPIEDFSSMAFLDRFVYRNPKGKTPVPTIHQKRIRPSRKVAVANSKQFWSMKTNDVRDEDAFLYRFFQTRLARGELSIEQKKVSTALDDDEEEFAQELFEKELEKGDGFVEDDDDDIDYEKEFAGVIEREDDSDTNDALDLVASDAQVDAMFVSDDEIESLDGDDKSDTNDQEKHQMTSDRAKVAGRSKSNGDVFASAEEFAELMALSEEAARANKQVDHWQGAKQRRKHSRRSNNKVNSTKRPRQR